MKRYRSLILIYVLAATATAQRTNPPTQNITHVATAVNHLTVFEFHEPVTMAAAGSTDFQIERQEDKVFVKPLKTGAATDLFVWTASRRFSYELETTEEVTRMNFSIDSPVPIPPPQAQSTSSPDQIADMMLKRVFLGSEAIRAPGYHAPKNKVSVRVEEVFRSKSSVYVRYALENKTKQPYHVPAATAVSLEPREIDPALPTRMREQLDDHAVEELGATKQTPLPVALAESGTAEVPPGESTQGIVVIRMELASPVVVQLTFDAQVKATVVL